MSRVVGGAEGGAQDGVSEAKLGAHKGGARCTGGGVDGARHNTPLQEHNGWCVHYCSSTNAGVCAVGDLFGEQGTRGGCTRHVLYVATRQQNRSAGQAVLLQLREHLRAVRVCTRVYHKGGSVDRTPHDNTVG